MLRADTDVKGKTAEVEHMVQYGSREKEWVGGWKSLTGDGSGRWEKGGGKG